MPEVTHDWLINFQGRDVSATVAIDALMAKLEQLRASIGQTTAAMEGMWQRAGGRPTTGGGVSGFEDPWAGTQTQEPSPRRPRTWSERMTARFEQTGAGQDYINQVTQRYNELLETGIPKATAFSMAQREITKSLLGVGEAAGKAGAETSRMVDYTIRYLIRYFLIWQTLRVVQDLMRETTEATHEQQWAMHDLQTATQATDAQMQAYGGTLLTISQTTPAVRAAALVGSLAIGGEATQWAAQLAMATREEPGEWIAFLRQLQEQHGYTMDEIEADLDRIIIAYSNATLVGDNFFSNYPKWMNDAIVVTDAFADAVERAAGVQERQMNIWQRLTGIQDWGAAAQRGELVQEMRAAYLERPAEERATLERQFRGEMGWGEPLIDVGAMAQLPEFYQWLAESQTTMGPPPMEQAMREGGWQFATGFAGTMQQAEFDKLGELVDATRAQWDEQKIRGTITEKSFWVMDAMGEHIEYIENYAELISMATTEMNERQRAAVYNWPGGAPLIVMPGAASQVSAPYPPSDTTTGGGLAGGGGISGGWQPSQIDWNNPFVIPLVIPPQYRVGQAPNMSTPSGPATGSVGGGTTPWLPMILKTQVDLDGKKVGEGTNVVLGDMYTQAAKAAYGGGGAIATPF